MNEISILSFNLNGLLEDKLHLSEFCNYISDFDIILLSETWTHKHCTLDLKGYDCISKHRERKKHAKRDSGGLVCYIRKQISQGIKLKPWEWEDGMCLFLDKRFFGLSEDTYLLHVYMRGSNSTRNDLVIGLDCWEILFEKVSEISSNGSNIIIAGDMNAHTAEKQETIIYEYDNFDSEEDNQHFDFTNHFNNLYSYKITELEHFGMSSLRKNQDKTTNTYGTRLLELTNACGLIFLNGRKGDDKNIGAYTFYNHIGKATDDYMICNKTILGAVTTFKVHDINIWSDHCPISCKIKCFTKIDHENNRTKAVTYKWKEEEKSDFISKLKTQSITDKLKKMNEMLDQNADKEAVEEILIKLTNIITTAGNNHTNLANRNHENDTRKIKFKNKKWFDNECKIQRKIFFDSFAKFKQTDSENDKIKMCAERSLYNRICKIKRKENNRREAIKLISKSKNNPKAFWKNVKNNKNNTLPDIDFFKHFKNLAETEATLGTDGEKEVNEIEGGTREQGN